MVSRSAYAQLGYSPLLLAGTVAGMVLTYLLRRRCSRCSAAGLAQAAGLVRLAADGAGLPADAALLPRLAALGRWRCRRSPRPTRSSPCSRRWRSGAAAAACGRAAPRPWRASHDGLGRLRFGQGPPGRELPGRLLAGPARELRPAILAFYRFARAADDVADHPQAGEPRKSSSSWRAWRRGCAAKPAPARKARRCMPSCRRAASPIGTRSICWRPSGATSPSGATPTGPS